MFSRFMTPPPNLGLYLTAFSALGFLWVSSCPEPPFDALRHALVTAIPLRIVRDKYMPAIFAGALRLSCSGKAVFRAASAAAIHHAFPAALKFFPAVPAFLCFFVHLFPQSRLNPNVYTNCGRQQIVPSRCFS